VSTETQRGIPQKSIRSRTQRLSHQQRREEVVEMDALSAGIRAAGVYSTALRVMVNIRVTQWRERRVKKRLGISMDDEFEGHPTIDEMWERMHEANAKIVSNSIVDLKGLWIKVGQFLSSRPDIMPFPYIVHFKKLQDSLPSRPWNEVDETLQKALGSDYRKRYFSMIVEKPLSSASIAQVHRATLRNGENVIIKARHRNVERLMHNDLGNLETLCNWIAWLNADYDFRQIVKEWIPAVKEELDLTNEAKNLKEIRKNMEKAGLTVIIPRVPDERLVKPDVLVMEYCDGFSVREVAAFDEHGVDRSTLLERICKAFAVQMHTDGIFNADPHPGNILISTDPKQNGGDPSVPVLLDFGLTRRFDADIKVAFSRLVHSCYVMDVQGLLRSFDEMGLKVRDQDPFQDIVSLRSAFRTIPASEAKAERERWRKEYKEKEKANPRTKRPVDAWPGELVFFVRVIGLLKGLCSSMEVRYPYLKTTAAVALETLKNAISKEDQAAGLFNADTLVPSGGLQNTVLEALKELNTKEQLLGMQVAAMHKGSFIVDVSAGTLGVADPRPVEPNTLFNVFSVTKGIAATLLHMAIQRTGASYDDLVSKYWAGFEENGKAECTLRHVLNHQAGLAGVLPDIATIDEILDWNNMITFLQSATPAHAPGEKEEYHYLTFGYLVGGILNGMTGKSVDELVTEWIVEPLKLKDNLLIGLPKTVSDDRLAVLYNGYMTDNKDGMLQSFGSEQSPMANAQPRWERFKGAEHMSNPTTFNMRAVREACIPSANGHMSARALASFYSALTNSSDTKLIDLKPVMEAVEIPQVERSSKFDAYMGSTPSSYALGFRVYRFRRNSDQELVYGFGHPGLGGSFGLVIPEEDFSIGITKSYLTADNSTIHSIVRHACSFLDLTPEMDS